MARIIEKLIDNFFAPEATMKDGEKIKINTVIAKAALVYEKIRNAVDYQEDHLVRKNAIHRILKRKLVYEKLVMENYLLDKFHNENMSEQLLQELIRGRYVGNDVSVSLISVVDTIVKKYNQLLSRVKEMEGRLEKGMFDYFLEMAAVEIEQALISNKQDKALINAMFSALNPRVKLQNSDIDDKERELQVYLACHRALSKWDAGMLRHLLLNLYYPEWKHADDALILKLANNIGKVVPEFEKQINHPWQKQFQKVMQKNIIIFWTIRDIMEANPKTARSIFADPELLETEIKKAITKRYKGVYAKLQRGVVRSIIYVFFTKMILALAIEFPMDWYIAGAINYFTVAVNITFPPLLMFVVAIFIRMPKKENTEQIIQEIKNIALADGRGAIYELKDPKRRGKSVRFMFNLIYTVSFVFSLFVIFFFLNKFDFNVVSSLIFVLFLTLVSFFGIRIRRPVADLLAVEKRDNFIGSIIDFFALPFVSMGRWMSNKFSKINFIAIFLDVIIEAPFKLIIEVFEDLFGFFREKKEDVLSE